MSPTEHDKSQETGKHESTDRPEGTVDEDANPPLADPAKTDVDRDQALIPPQDSSAGPGTASRDQDEQQNPN